MGRKKEQIIKKRTLTDDEFNDIRKKKEDKINNILDKISKKGINSLTKEESEFLKNLNK